MIVFKDVFIGEIYNTLNWVWSLITFQTAWYHNYFWGLILISLIVWGLEILFPWRKQQGVFRKDFWLDGFYMFFNFFLFTIFISGIYALLSKLINSLGFNITDFAILNIQKLNSSTQLLIFFVISDFFQWFTHVLLHRYDFFWKFHQIHHSVKEMGFAAHLRYHWMENILYKPLKTLAIMLLGGFEPEQAYIVHFIAITIGHLNHANLNITWGSLKYVFNNPVMHLYHHAYELPKNKKHGVNFGISLSLWDYIFRTHYIPKVDKNTKLGFKGDKNIPTSFWKQLWVGFR
ncbi:sterol desaturase family protein [Wenyingzhuangia sp. 1_MG-2023]|nr:sterol desaturase family protein [Wenyingzhuangia sp. 1_MG-2023]